MPAYATTRRLESIKHTRLHTAAPGKPLCSLGANIRCGNSLVGPDFAEFYRQKHTTLFEQADENERERINAFDWEAADVFTHGGFDCVVGTPPYIKLQHFRRTQPDVADYLVGQASSLPNRKQDACATYESTQTGNFDMYLPFIEKGILKRIAPNRYETRAGEEVAIEDAIMHPLVSGPEAKRYQVPKTDTYLLFPYLLERGTAGSAVPSPGQASRLSHVPKARLFSAVEMQARFPLAWAYFKQHESALRTREKGKLNDEQWYRFGRNQNIDKQELPRLFVAQTVPSLRVCFDDPAAFYYNNVRVNGILPSSLEDGWYLLGILNAPVCDFVFRRIAKAKEGGYFEANKQFIAPLPIPDATPEDRAEISRRARELQELHTQRRDLVEKLARRLNSPQTAPLTPAPKPDWLWSDIGTPESWKGRVPPRPSPLEGRVPHRPQCCTSPEWSGATPTASSPAAELTARALTAWAKQRHAAALQDRLDELDALLQPGVTLTIENTGDELALRINDREILRLYDRPDTAFIAAQWRHTLRDANVTEAYDGKRLLRNLLTLRTTTDTPPPRPHPHPRCRNHRHRRHHRHPRNRPKRHHLPPLPPNPRRNGHRGGRVLNRNRMVIQQF